MQWLHRLTGTPIDDQTRAELLSQWARMETSGIDPLRAMDTLSAGARPAVAGALSTVIGRMKTGVHPTRAWALARLLEDWQARLLLAGFESGRAEWALGSLAKSVGARAARWRKFQARMAYPLIVLVLAGLLAALPPLAADQIGSFGFVMRVAVPPLLLAFGIVVAVRTLRAGEDSRGARALLVLPVAGSWLRRRCRADFIAVLVQSLKTGIPAIQAIELAADAVRPVVLGRQFSRIIVLLDGGTSLADALRSGGVLDDTGYALVHSGEKSGALDDMLERVATCEDEKAEAYAEQVATWIPRLIYIAIAAMMLLSIVGFWRSYSPGG